MSPDNLFLFCSLLVLPAWLLLFVSPLWNWGARWVSALMVPVFLATVYLVLVVGHLRSSQGGIGSLEEVRLAFDNRYILLAGWIHYLAFDLFIGSWQVREAQRLGIPHLWVVPCLVLTLLFGPVGLLSFLGVRLVLSRRLTVEEAVWTG